MKYRIIRKKLKNDLLINLWIKSETDWNVALTNIEKNPENAVKITNASEDITFERTKENNIPATADNSNDAEYAQK